MVDEHVEIEEHVKYNKAKHLVVLMFYIKLKSISKKHRC